MILHIHNLGPKDQSIEFSFRRIVLRSQPFPADIQVTALLAVVKEVKYSIYGYQPPGPKSQSNSLSFQRIFSTHSTSRPILSLWGSRKRENTHLFDFKIILTSGWKASEHERGYIPTCKGFPTNISLPTWLKEQNSNSHTTDTNLQSQKFRNPESDSDAPPYTSNLYRQYPAFGFHYYCKKQRKKGSQIDISRPVLLILNLQSQTVRLFNSAGSLLGRLDVDKMNYFRWLLNSNAFKHYIVINKADEQLNLWVTHILLPLILRLFHLRWISAHVILNVNEANIRIGAEIPYAKWVTIKLQMRRLKLNFYVDVLVQCVPRLRKEFDEEKGTRRRNMTEHRRLSHVILNSKLDKIYVKATIEVKNVNSWYEKYHDHEVSHYFKLTRPASYLFNHSDRVSVTQYVSFHSVKLQFLSGLAHSVCNLNSHKFIVFCDWSVT